MNREISSAAKDSLRVLELFAGIGGFRIASDSLGLRTIWANDIDKKAQEVYTANFGKDVFHVGDIRQLWLEIPAHDLLTAGFPCQPFSSAGKKEGIRDPRGTLFQEIIRVLEKHQPRYFVLENVKRLLSMEQGQHFATILDSLSGLGYSVEWRLLNATNFGLAQNRERLFMIGDRQSPQSESHLLVPADLPCVSPQTLSALVSGKWSSITKHSSKFPNWGIAFMGSFLGNDIPHTLRVKPESHLKDVLEPEVSGGFDYTDDTLRRLDSSKRIDRFVNGVQIIFNQNGGARMGYTVFGTAGFAPTLTGATSRHYERYRVGERYRRLTNVEYARLQGFSDDHCRVLSAYDQYTYYGNAVPPVMVEWVLSRLLSDKTPLISAKGAKVEFSLDEGNE